jgi:hypothetical protein
MQGEFVCTIFVKAYSQSCFVAAKNSTYRIVVVVSCTDFTVNTITEHNLVGTALDCMVDATHHVVRNAKFVQVHVEPDILKQ